MTSFQVPFLIQTRTYTIPMADQSQVVTNCKVLPLFRVALVLSDDTFQIWSLLLEVPKLLSTLKLTCSIKKMISVSLDEILMLSKKNNILRYRIPEESSAEPAVVQIFIDLPITPLQAGEPLDQLDFWQNCSLEEFPTSTGDLFCVLEKRVLDCEYAYYLNLIRRKPLVQGDESSTNRLEIKRLEYKTKLSTLEILTLNNLSVVLWSQLQSTVDNTEFLLWDGDKEWKQHQLKEKNYGTLVAIKEGRPGYLLFFFNLNGGKCPGIIEFDTLTLEQTTRSITFNSNIPLESGFWISDVMFYDETKDLLIFEYTNFLEETKKIVLMGLNSSHNFYDCFDFDEDEVFLFEAKTRKFGIKYCRNWFSEGQPFLKLNAIYLIQTATNAFYTMKTVEEFYGPAIVQDCISMLLKGK